MAQADADKIDALEQKKKDLEAGKKLTEKSSPLEAYNKQAADIQRLLSVGAITARVAQNALAEANKDARGALFKDSYQFESPKASVRGSAEAELSRDRQTVADKMNANQIKAIAKQDEANAIALRQIAAIEANKPEQELVADF